MLERPRITLRIVDVETAQIDDAAPGAAILEARTAEGDLAYLSFDAKGLSSLETMLREVQKKMAGDQGVQ